VKILVNRPVNSHPYLIQLYSKLRSMGMQVEFFDVSFTRFPLMLYNLLKVKSPTIFHLHWIENIPSHPSAFKSFKKAIYMLMILIITKLIPKLKIVITMHNLYSHERHHPTLERVFVAIMLRLADAIITHTNYSKERISRYYGVCEEKITVIPHGNFIKYYGVVSTEEARMKMNIEPGKMVYLFFGHVRKYKGLDTLISALSKLIEDSVEKLQKTLFIIAGKFREPSLLRSLMELKQKCSGSIIIKNEFIPDKDVPTLISCCDVGILPYHEITTPGSLLLFISFGKPVIIRNLGSLKELTSQDFCIFFTDEKSLYKAILQALELKKKGQLELMGKRALNHALKYDWFQVSLKHFKLFNKLFRK